MKIYIPQRTTAQQRPASSSKGHPLKQIIDNRPGAIQQKEMLDGINSVGKVIQCSKFTLSDPQDPEQTVEINTTEKEKTLEWLNKQLNSDNYKFINLFIEKIKNSTEDTDKALLAKAREMQKKLLNQIRASKFDLRPHVGQGTMTVGDAEHFPDGMFTTGAAPCVAMAIRSETLGVFGVAHFDSDVNHDDGIDKPLFASLKGNDKTAVSIRERVLEKCWGGGVYGDVEAIFNSLKSFKTMIVNKIKEKNLPFDKTFNGFQIILTRGMGWDSNDLYGFYSDAIQKIFPGSELLPPETKGGVSAGGGTVKAINDSGVANIGSYLTIYRYEERTTPLNTEERVRLHKVLTNVLLTLNHTESQKQNNAVDNKFIWDSLKRFSDIPKISDGELSGKINGLIDKIDVKVDSFKKQLTSDGKRPDLTRKEALTSIHLKFMNDAYRILSSMLNVAAPKLILDNIGFIKTVLDIIIGTTEDMRLLESSKKTKEECQKEFNIICNGASKKIGELNSMFKAKLVPVEKKEGSGTGKNFGIILEKVIDSVDKTIGEKSIGKNRHDKLLKLAQKKLLWSGELEKLKEISDAEDRQSKERDLSANVKTELEAMMDFPGIDKATIGQILEPLSRQQAEKSPNLIMEMNNMESGKEQSNFSVLKKKTTSVYKNTSLSNKKFEPGEKRSRSEEELTKLVDKSNEFKKKPHSVNKSNKKGK